MLTLRDRIYYKILPLSLGLAERFEAIAYNRIKPELPENKAASGNNHLLLTHGRGGGVDKFVEDAAAVIESGNRQAWILHFQPLKRQFVLSRGKIHTADSVIFKFPLGYAKMVLHLQSLGIGKLHIHHTRYLPVYFVKDLSVFAQALGVPYDYTMHDFIAFCPRIHLIDENFHYCGMPESAAACTACVSKNGALTTTTTDTGEWREIGRALLNKASERIAPSNDTADRHKKILGEMNIRVEPHDTPQTTSRKLPAKSGEEAYIIAVIGRIHRYKGAEIILSCARDAIQRHLPIQFVIIGDSIYSKELRKAGVNITGTYQEEELPALLMHSGASLVFLPSIWPETYSYVLSHIWKNSYFPVAFDLGAPAERIKQAQHGLVLPFDIAQQPDTINNALLQAAQNQHD